MESLKLWMLHSLGIWLFNYLMIAPLAEFDRHCPSLMYLGKAQDRVAEWSVMLPMAGGKKALESLRQPVTVKLKDIIVELAAGGLTVSDDVSFAQKRVNKIENILDTRLDELTPVNAKKLLPI